MPTSVRLDSETEALLRRLAEERGASRSEILREAIRRLGEERRGSLGGKTSVLDEMRDLVGVAGDSRAAPSTRAEVRARLRERNWRS